MKDPFMEGYYLGRKHGAQRAYAICLVVAAVLLNIAVPLFFLR